MRYTALAILLTLLITVTACHKGTSGAINGRVIDGFGNPLGGPGVTVTLSGKGAVHHPDQWGNFYIYAPVGDYVLRIAFSNPDAGLDLTIEDEIRVVTGGRNLGTYTLLNVQNFDAWEFYRQGDYYSAIDKFNEQAALAHSGQLVNLPYMRWNEGEPNQNTLLTQGVLSAKNGLGWCYSRGLGDPLEGKINFLDSLAGGYNNYDAMVGLAAIAIGEGIAQGDEEIKGVLDYLMPVIDEPGNYNSTQIHDAITEIDLIAVKSLAEFMLMRDNDSLETADSIRLLIATQGNPGTKNLMEVLDSFR